MHDPTSLFRFQEHDVYIPMVTLEELDHNKKGMSEVARNARQTSRFLDEIVSSAIADIDEGISLKATRHQECDREIVSPDPSDQQRFADATGQRQCRQSDHRRR